MELSDLVQTKPLAKYENKLLDKKIISELLKNKGTESVAGYKYNINDVCLDIITHNKAYECKVLEYWNQLGWNYYKVQYNNNAIRILREKDLIKK